MDWHERFLAACRRGGCANTTLYAYASAIRRIESRGLKIQSCSVADVEKVLDKFAVEGSRETHIYLATIMKRALRFLGRNKIAEAVIVPKETDNIARVKEKVLQPEEVTKLVKKAKDPQDRLLVLVLYESGARIGEIYNLRIKDVQFDDYSAILNLTSKSGTRRARVFTAIPDLRRQLNEHPDRTNPNARLFFLTHQHRAGEFNIVTFYNRIRHLGEEVLGKKVHPHMFRHTRATEDSRYYTDREMMVKFGWKRSDQVTVYSHLTMKDIDDKTLILHGLKRKEKVLKPIVQIQKCSSCGVENAPVAVYCNKCGQILASATDEKTQQRIQQLEERLNQATREWKSLDRYQVGYIVSIAKDRLAQREGMSTKEEAELTKIATAPWSPEYDKIRDRLEPEIERAKIDALRAQEAGPEGIDQLFSDSDPIKEIMKSIFALYSDWDKYFEFMHGRKRKPLSKTVA